MNEPLELVWLHYNNSRYILLLKFGVHNNKLFGLEASKIPDELTNILKIKLKDMDGRSRSQWVKTNEPQLMSSYLTLNIASAKILNTYNLYAQQDTEESLEDQDECLG